MMKRARSKAEETFARRFAEKQRRDKSLSQEQDAARREMKEKIERLRALRLAKEAANREAAEQVAANKTSPSKKIRTT